MKRRNFLKALAVTSLAPVAMLKAEESVPMTATEVLERQDAYRKSATGAFRLMSTHQRNMMLYGTSAYTVDEDNIIDSVIHPSQLVDFGGQLTPIHLFGSTKKFKVETL